MTFVFFVSGCSTSYLKSGSVKSDPSVLSEGLFSEINIDTSIIPGNFTAYSVFCGDDHYSYLIQSNELYSTRSTGDFYFINMSLSGEAASENSLEFPIYSENGSLYIDDNCTEIANYYNSFKHDFSASATYPGFSFDESGNLSSVCVLDVIYYSEEINADSFIRDLYLVKWDSMGNLVSVESTDVLPEYKFSSVSKIFTGNNDRSYRISSSGLVLLDSEGKYDSKYFDFLNSGILSSGIVNASVADDDHFSCIYKDSEGNTRLSCFVRKNDNPDCNALVLACSGLDNELLADIYSFNEENPKYKIAVFDYSDRAVSFSPEEGWSLLKADILNGFMPDMIYNSTGCDTLFIRELDDYGRLADLSSAFAKDKALNGLSISTKARGLFYGSENIYCVVPSYYYRTVVGSADTFSQYEAWDIDSYLSFAEPLSGNKVMFLNDTSEAFISRFLEFCGNDLMDYSSNRASFDTDAFISVLRYASTLPFDIDEANALLYSETNLGEYMLADIDCYYLGDLNLKATTMCSGSYVDLGYPGFLNKGSGVISATGSFMISADSAFNNECWKFVSQYLTEEYQTQSVKGIPVSETAYNNWISIREPHPSNIYELSYMKDGIEYRVSDPDDIQAGLIIDHISDCNRRLFNDYTVKQIVLKYADDFFDGKITAEEAAKNIDMEVEAYLAS